MKHSVLGLVICIALAACMPMELSQQSEVSTQTRAVPIIEAINRYYEEHDDLPDQLTHLVPDYIALLPKDTLDQEFRYRQSEDSYELCFDGSPYSRNDGCCYHSRFDLWDCTDGIDH